MIKDDNYLLTQLRTFFKDKRNRTPEILCRKLNIPLEKLYELLKMMRKNSDLAQMEGTSQQIYIKPEKKESILAIADAHLGADCENATYLRTAFNAAQKSGVRNVLFVGDITEGIYPHCPKELKEKGIITTPDAMAEYAANTIPDKKDMTIYAVSGNHDLTYSVKYGVDVLDLIAKKRDSNFIYLGPNSANLLLGKCRIHLCHSSDIGNVNASVGNREWKISQYISSNFSVLNKPDILLLGHHHYAESYKSGNTNIQILPALITPRNGEMSGYTIIDINFDELELPVEIEAKTKVLSLTRRKKR